MLARRQKPVAILMALALGTASVPKGFTQDSAPAQSPNGQVSSTPQGGFVLKTNSELVLTNVVARDAKTGEFVRGLKQSDFTIYESGKQQQISTFDFQSVDMAKPLNEATISGLAAGPKGTNDKAVVVARPEDLRNHRLIELFLVQVMGIDWSWCNVSRT